RPFISDRMDTREGRYTVESHREITLERQRWSRLSVLQLVRANRNTHITCSGKGLAAHLEVPLPYLLYRVNARFQEEIRGLKDIQGALSPSAAIANDPKFEVQQSERPVLAIRTGIHTGSKLSSSSRVNTPRNVHARLNSLGNYSPKPKKATSSSTLTV